MPQIDPVILQLRADVATYNADVNKAALNTERQLGKIAAAGAGISSTLKSSAAGFVAALGTGAILQATKAGLDYAASLGEVAGSLGVSTQLLQEFRYAATQNGASIGEADAALGNFSQTLGNAFNGKKEAVEAVNLSLKGTGKTVADLAKLTDRDRFLAFTDGISRIKDSAQQAAVALDVVRRGGRAIIPTLDAGAEAFKRQAAEAERYGLILTNGQINRADVVADKIQQLTNALQVRIAGAVADNAQALGTLANGLVEVASAALQAFSAYTRWNSALKVKSPSFDTREQGRRELMSTGAGRGDLRKFVTDRSAQIRADQAGGQFTYSRTDLGVYGEARRRRTASASDKAAQDRELAAGQRALKRFDQMDARDRAPRTPAYQLGDASVAPVGGRKARGGGGSKSSGPSQAEIDARFAQDLAALRTEQLRDELEITTDASARRAIMRQLDDEEYQARVAQIETEKDYSKAKKAQLLEALAKRFGRTPENQKGDDNIIVTADTSALGKARRLEEARQKEREAADLAQARYDVESGALQDQYDLAKTQEERRDLAGLILDLEYRHKEAILNAIIASEAATAADKERAQIAKDALAAQRGSATEKSRRDTAGPLEQYQRETSLTGGQINEAAQNIAVNGLKSLNDGLVDAIMNSKNLGDVFGNIANSIIADLIRIAIQQLVVNSLIKAISGGFGGGGFKAPNLSSQLDGLSGRASGGYVGPGQMVRVNEQRGGAEYLRMGSQGGTVIPLGQVNQDVTRPTQNTMQSSVSISVDARGAGPREVDTLVRRIDQLERDLPGTIVSTVSNAQSRRIIGR